MRIDLELSGVDIVVLGDFNPTIFSPRWFSSNGLIRESVADSAQVQVIHPEISDFTADWLRLQVARDRFLMGTTQAPYVRLRDLVLQIFSECLPHTPLRAFGINFGVHFLVDSRATRDRIGTALAPLGPWGIDGGRDWTWMVRGRRYDAVADVTTRARWKRSRGPDQREGRALCTGGPEWNGVCS